MQTNDSQNASTKTPPANTILGGWLKEREKNATATTQETLRFVKTTMNLMTAFQGPKEAQILLCVLLSSGRVAANVGKPVTFIGLSMMGVQTYQREHGHLDDEDKPSVDRCALQVETALRILWDLSEIKKVDVETGEVWFRADGQEWFGVGESVRLLTEGTGADDVKFRDMLLKDRRDEMPEEVRAAQTSILKRVFDHVT